LIPVDQNTCLTEYLKTQHSGTQELCI